MRPHLIYSLLVFSILSSASVFSAPQKAQAQALAMSATGVQPLAVGAQIRDAVVRDLEGRERKLLEVLNGKPAVLIFYRGGWCPYCNLQLGKLQKVEKSLQDLGFEIFALSPDKPENLKQSIAKHSLTYTLLSDSQVHAGRAFGIAYGVSPTLNQSLLAEGINIEEASGESHRILVVPSAFLVDSTGVIRFMYSNADYTVRVDENTLLLEAQKLRELQSIASKE